MINRAKDRKQFVVIENVTMNDSRLSFDARGILAYLLSRPDDWQVNTKDLIAQSPAGRHLVLRALKELETYGYLERKRVRLPDGTYGWQTTVIECPPRTTKRPKFYDEYLKSPEWAKRRQAKLKQAKFACQLCNSNVKLSVHHRTYENLGRELDTNLTVLCKECHAKFHDKLPE